MSFPNERTYSFDANMLLSDNAAALTANGYSQVGGAQAILDLGGNQGTTPKQQARMSGVAVIDVTAIDISSTDERYTLKLLGSNDPAFPTPTVLASIELGKGAVATPVQADSVTGRVELPFTTELAGTKYQYLALYLVVAGTTPSISFLCFVAVLPEP